MKRFAVWFTLAVVLCAGCSAGTANAPTVTVEPITPTRAASLPTSTATPPALPETTVTATPTVATTGTVTPTATRTVAPTGTLSPTLLATPTITATPGEPSGTVVQDNGQELVLSHPGFYWTMKLPRDWVMTRDRGYEVEASNPQQTAHAHLLSQTWLTKDRKPNARAYVEYWKNSELGNIFPIFADGDLVAESETSQDKLGGPYLRYEFDDAGAGVRYLQVYASGGGPNSLVLTVWAKRADFENVKSTLEGILNSVELVKEN